MEDRIATVGAADASMQATHSKRFHAMPARGGLFGYVDAEGTR